MSLTGMLVMVASFVLLAIMGLAFLYWYTSVQEKSKNASIENGEEEEKEPKNTYKQYTKLSIHDFMKFDKIEDNMIVENNGEKYLMVVECEGINYDLMSGVEKASVESGFVQFLNTLRYPIQIYTQTRTLKISSSIENYRKKVEEIKYELDKKQKDYNLLMQSGEYSNQELQNERLEIVRLQNMYDYGVDVVDSIEQISHNKNVLRKHYYIIIPYYKSEIGSELLDEEEKRNMIFSELYTRAQATIRTLFACSMKCKILDSTELAELLYIAYNRDDSEIYGIDKALQAGYDELYTTAPDVLDKKMQEINKAIEEEALALSVEKINEVKSEKQKRVENKEKNFDALVREMAEILIKENEQYVGEDIAKEAIEKIKKQPKTKEEEVNADEEKKTRRTRKSV